jgi:hypothetical protein
MVKVFDKAGKHIYNEPPYTWEEERDFYRAMAGPKVIVHGPRPAPAAKTTQPPTPSKSPRRPRQK